LNGGSVNWTTATNWNPDGVPVNNGTANIVMAGAIDLSNTVDTSYDIASLAFNSTAGPFTINGATLTIRGGGINNTSSANQMLALPIIVNSGQTWSNSSVLSVTGTTVMLAAPLITYGPGTTRFNTLIIGNSMLQFNGTGVVELLNGNTYTGSTSINNGTLAIGHASAISGSSSLNIFGGTLTALGGSRTISNNTTCAGTFSLGGDELTGAIGLHDPHEQHRHDQC
jgi:fibronectin-binding autotransporter adhesin